jgi:hypothetical protein
MVAAGIVGANVRGPSVYDGPKKDTYAKQAATAQFIQGADKALKAALLL